MADLLTDMALGHLGYVPDKDQFLTILAYLTDLAFIHANLALNQVSLQLPVQAFQYLFKFDRLVNHLKCQETLSQQ